MGVSCKRPVREPETRQQSQISISGLGNLLYMVPAPFRPFPCFIVSSSVLLKQMKATVAQVTSVALAAGVCAAVA